MVPHFATAHTFYASQDGLSEKLGFLNSGACKQRYFAWFITMQEKQKCMHFSEIIKLQCGKICHVIVLY